MHFTFPSRLRVGKALSLPLPRFSADRADRTLGITHQLPSPFFSPDPPPLPSILRRRLPAVITRRAGNPPPDSTIPLPHRTPPTSLLPLPSPPCAAQSDRRNPASSPPPPPGSFALMPINRTERPLPSFRLRSSHLTSHSERGRRIARPSCEESKGCEKTVFTRSLARVHNVRKSTSSHAENGSRGGRRVTDG